jgi:hypothetical protein
MVAEVEDCTLYLTKAIAKGKRCWHNGASFTLADCGKKVTLDFSIDRHKDRVRSLRKIDLIVDTLAEFRDHLVEECEVAKAIEAHNKKVPRRKLRVTREDPEDI